MRKVHDANILNPLCVLSYYRGRRIGIKANLISGISSVSQENVDTKYAQCVIAKLTEWRSSNKGSNANRLADSMVPPPLSLSKSYLVS